MIEEYDAKIDKAKAEIEEIRTSIMKAESCRDNGDGRRDKLLEELHKLQKEKGELDLEIKNYERSDPKIV